MGDDEDVKPVFDDLSGDEFDEGQSVFISVFVCRMCVKNLDKMMCNC